MLQVVVNFGGLIDIFGCFIRDTHCFGFRPMELFYKEAFMMLGSNKVFFQWIVRPWLGSSPLSHSLLFPSQMFSYLSFLGVMARGAAKIGRGSFMMEQCLERLGSCAFRLSL